MWLRACQLGALTAPHISVYWPMILTHREPDYKQLPVCLADVMKQSFTGQFILTEWGPICFCLFHLNFSGAWHFTSSKVHRNRGQCVQWVVPMFQLYQQQWTRNREEKEDNFWSRLISMLTWNLLVHEEKCITNVKLHRWWKGRWQREVTSLALACYLQV